MALSTDQSKWLSALVKKDIAAKNTRAIEESKDALLSQISKQVNENAQEIFDGFNIEVVVGKKKMPLLDYAKRDQTQEFDLEEELEGYDFKDEKDRDKHERAKRILNGLALQLDTATVPVYDPVTGDPVMEEVEEDELDGENKPTGQKVKRQVPKTAPLVLDEKEKTDLFYKPLVRQGLCPETFVPDDFSETKEMLDGAFDSYAERLKKEGTGAKPYEIVKEIAKWTGTAASFAGTIAGGALMIQDTKLHPDEATNWFSDKGFSDTSGETTQHVDAWTHGLDYAAPPTDGEHHIKFIQVVLEATLTGVGGGLEVWEDVDTVRERVGEGGEDEEERLEERSEKDKKEDKKERKKPLRVTKAGATSALIASSIGAALNEAFVWVDLAPVVGNAYTTFANPRKAAKLIGAAKFTKHEVVAAMQVFADAFPAALAKCDPNVKGSTQVLADTAGAISAKFMSRVNANADALFDNFEKGKLDVVLSSTTGWAKSAALLAAGFNLDDDDDQSGDITTDPSSAALSQFANNEENRKAMQAQADESITRQLVAELDEESERGKKEALEIAAENQRDKKDSLIVKQIKKLEHEKQIMGLATSVAAMTFEVASKFLAPLAAGGSLVKIAVNVAKAANRWRDVYNSLHAQEDFFKDANALSAPLANFVHNGEMHRLHYALQAAAEFIKMCGSLVECSGIAAIAGRATTVAAASAQTMESVLYEVRLRYNLEQGWKAYRRALLRPENRKLGLKATRDNPTLAKYAVAWGAVIRKDPLVADFISNTGLTEQALQEEGANINDVQRYLEARFSDDKVAVGRMVVSDDWAPSPLELTVVCWKTCVARALSKAELEPLSTDSVEACLVRVETLNKQRTGQNPPPTIRQDGIAACNALDLELGGVHPRRKVDKTVVPHHQMVGIVDQYRKLVTACRKEFEKH